MNIRHGDMALIEIGALPEGLVASDSKTLLVGSGGNPHTVQRGVFYPHADEQIVGYLEAAVGCKVFHPEHGPENKAKTLREVSVPAATYAVYRQAEQTHEGMRPVED